MKIYNLFNPNQLDVIEDRCWRKRSPIMIDEAVEKVRQEKVIHELSLKTKVV